MENKSYTANTRDLSKEPKYSKYMIVYLLLTFGFCYTVGISYSLFPETMNQTFGPLDISSPIIALVLNAPSIAGILMYLWYGGLVGMLKFLRTTIPQKKDLGWIPVIIIVMFPVVISVRYFCMLFGVDVPEITNTPGDQVTIFLTNLWNEVGMLGSAWGWYGFFFPFVQRYFKDNLKAGALTGLVLGLYLLPGFDISTGEGALTYGIYVLSFMVYSMIISYILNDTNNCVLFFILSFWIMGTGSKWQLYYWIYPTMLIELCLFLIILFTIRYYFKKTNKDTPKEEFLQVFPDFIEKRSLQLTGNREMEQVK